MCLKGGFEGTTMSVRVLFLHVFNDWFVEFLNNYFKILRSIIRPSLFEEVVGSTEFKYSRKFEVLEFWEPQVKNSSVLNKFCYDLVYGEQVFTDISVHTSIWRSEEFLVLSKFYVCSVFPLHERNSTWKSKWFLKIISKLSII